MSFAGVGVVPGAAVVAPAAVSVAVVLADGVLAPVVSVAEVWVDGVPAAGVPVAAALVDGVAAAAVPASEAIVVGVLFVEGSAAVAALPAVSALGRVLSLLEVLLAGLLERTAVSAFCVSWAGCPASPDPLPPQAARDSIISSARGRPG